MLGPLVALVYQPCYGDVTALHEVLHTLGAVQPGSPNYDNNGHCSDDFDVMCYSAGGFGAGIVCDDPDLEPLLDCNDDDYFNPAPGPRLLPRVALEHRETAGGWSPTRRAGRCGSPGWTATRRRRRSSPPTQATRTRCCWPAGSSSRTR